MAATTCPFCGYQMAALAPPPLMTSSGSRLRRRGRALLAAALFSTSVALSAAPLGCSAYGGPPEQFSPGILSTNQPSNALIFGDALEGNTLKRNFLLFNDGDLALTISEIRLTNNKNNAFQFVDLPSLPFNLSPGKDNGIRITLQFTQNGATSATARIEISSPDAENVDQNGEFLIKVQHNIQYPDPRWSCDGSIQFGTVAVGATATKECVLTNHGKVDLDIAKISYAKERGGANIDFKLDSITAPMKVKAGASVPFSINYKPSDASPLEDQGTFVLDVNGQIPQLRLQLKGTTKPARVDVIGVYPPCTTDADCETIDPRLTCREDSFAKTRQCLAESDAKPLLKLPPTMAGETSTRTFLIRNLSEQPLTIKSLTWTTKQGLFEVKLAVPLPVTLSPQSRLQASVVYTPKDATKVKDELQIEFANAPISSASPTSLLVEYSP